MSLAETHTREYDDAAARKLLARSIKAHQVELVKLAELRASIGRAANKLSAALKEEIATAPRPVSTSKCLGAQQSSSSSLTPNQSSAAYWEG
jgi:hypothetical protein